MKAVKFIASAAAMLALSAQAELVNISGTGLHTANESAMACTVIDTGTTLINGAVLVVFLAEGNGPSNPNIRVWSLDRSYITTNENWKDGLDISRNGVSQHINLADIYPRDPLYYPTLLRAPYQETDAAVFVAGLRGERFCAESFDKSGSGATQRVSISATDMNAVLYKSLPVKRANVSIQDESPIARALAAIQ